MKGKLHKMRTEQGDPINYFLELEESVHMNAYIGKQIKLTWSGVIECIVCQKVTKTSFGQGFCYPCFVNSPYSSPCIIHPELCRAHLGEGRDMEWEKENHLKPQIVYLAQSDLTKVGVTSISQIPTRWIDQGAISAIKIAETPNRYLAGLLEVALKAYFSDKTNWRKMLMNEIDPTIDLVNEKWKLEEFLPEDLLQYFIDDDSIETFQYPVRKYPEQIKIIALEKEGFIEGILEGIKGQYLLFDQDRVINIRKYNGYVIEFTTLN